MRVRNRRSRVRWICATTAPWALATGLLISFTASASNDIQAGVSFSPRNAVAYLNQAALVPPITASIAGGRLDLGRDILRSLPRYDLPDASANAVIPKADRKAGAGGDPVVERTGKGDPLVARVTLSLRANQMRSSLEQVGESRLLFGQDERLLPPTILMEGEFEAPEMEQAFEPWEAPEFTTTRQSTSVQSPAAAAAGSTGASASPTTPMVKRAVTLSSTTPAPVEATPIEIAAAPVSLQSPRLDKGYGESIISKSDDGERPRYADLIDPDNMNKEQRCLAEAVYFEARSEPEAGQAAVAQVVLNRVKSGLYPSSICGVVYQNRHRHLACQFTFACEGKALRTTDTFSWERAKRVATAVLEGKTYLADVGGATHYHADYVKPYWARRLKKMDVIGRHIFYKLKPGQT
ncbi:cell wall hydrolase [Microvirga sp. 2YAF29]|uniref:cell wall hydrolase n=1 Tax=Microvirga sp. 2YAF29 TaxID=3233031 RepID=UPI003F94DE2E